MKIYNITQFEKLKINPVSLQDFNTAQIHKYFPKSKIKLKKLIDERIEKEGNACDLNDIDTSNIKDMSGLFHDSDFNGDISKWDVFNVKHMNAMFEHSQFNGDISNWNVSNVIDMAYMFSDSKFNGDISNWNVSNVKFMDYMFYGCYTFNCDLSKWDVKMAVMTNMFYDCPIDANPPEWYHNNY